MTSVTLVRLGGRPDQPLLVLGPALDAPAATLWSATAERLAAHFQVVGWDLPGQGTNTLAPTPDLGVAGLARSVLSAVDDLIGGFQPATFHYAGVSVGGAVGLQLMLDAPHRVASATLLSTGARIGAATDEAYAAVCGAPARFDVRHRLGRIAAPVLVVAGSVDDATPSEAMHQIADGVTRGRLVVLDGIAHHAPVQAPEEVARLVREHALGPAEPEPEVGLGERSRALVTLTALVVSGRLAELDPHLRAALTHGVSAGEIEELLHLAAADGGLPETEATLRIAEEVLGRPLSLRRTPPGAGP